MFSFRRQDPWLFAAFVGSILYLGYLVDRAHFTSLFLAYGLGFYAYYHYAFKKTNWSLNTLIGHALMARLLLLPSMPLLSDDYHRFVWDGMVQLQGYSPFEVLPRDFQTESAFMKQLLADMNSPDYYSVYPPVMQGLFKGIAYAFGEQLQLQVIAMRLSLIVCDIGTLLIGAKILKNLSLPLSRLALYAFNPLVIVEVVGNLHFEGMMVFFCLLGLYLILHVPKASPLVRAIGGTVSMALAVSTKLVLFFALPSLMARLGFVRAFTFSLASLVLCLIGLRFYVDTDTVLHMADSLDLYFRNFEFNASLYNLTEYIASFWIPHYTAAAIGPYVSLALLLVLTLFILKRRSASNRAYYESLLLVLAIHLLFSSTVHPWYLVNLVAISVFCRYRFAILWSFLAVLSYEMYGQGFQESWWLIAIEYALVMAFAIQEFRKAPLSKG